MNDTWLGAVLEIGRALLVYVVVAAVIGVTFYGIALVAFSTFGR